MSRNWLGDVILFELACQTARRSGLESGGSLASYFVDLRSSSRHSLHIDNFNANASHKYEKTPIRSLYKELFFYQWDQNYSSAHPIPEPG